MLKIGSHVSYKKEEQLVGSVKEALSYNANTFMFYTGAPQNAIRNEIDDNKTKEAFELMINNNINPEDVVVHAPYIINLASNNDFAISFLKQELKRVEKLGMTKIVLHPGSSVSLSKEDGINNIIKGLNEVGESKVLILLETMAGKGTELASNFNEIKKIMDGVNYNLGVCFDTCHTNDAGYDLNDFDKVLNEFDEIVGIDKIKCVHINDSKNILNSHKDRHENIGYGQIGFDNLIKIIYHEKIKDVPKILETPYIENSLGKKVYPPYKFEIEMIKTKAFNSNLVEDITNYYK